MTNKVASSRLERSENAFGPNDPQEMFETYVEDEVIGTVTVLKEWWEEAGRPETIEVTVVAVDD